MHVYRSALKREGVLTLTISVRPSAAKTTFKETRDDGSLKIDVAAPPEDGKANEALVRYLAEEFSVPRGSVEILSGFTSRKKVVRVRQEN